jgi:hypothetical protein
MTDGNGFALVKEPVDFDIKWKDELISGDFWIKDNLTIISHHDFTCNVAGQQVFIPNYKELVIADNLEPGESVTPNTWYFLYITRDGAFYFSTKFPRVRDRKLGWYHKDFYARCVGLFYKATTFDSSRKVLILHEKILSKDAFISNSTTPAEVLVGGITTWDKTLMASVGVTLPSNWVECNGQTLSDSQSILNGKVIPNLNVGNGTGRYLRGTTGATGATQTDQNKTHTHTGPSHTHGISITSGNESVTHNHTQAVHGHSLKSGANSGTDAYFPVSGLFIQASTTYETFSSPVTTAQPEIGNASVTHTHSISGTSNSAGAGATGNGTADGSEVRPLTMTMCYIMRIF